MPISRVEKGVDCKNIGKFTAKVFNRGCSSNSYCSAWTRGKSVIKSSLHNLNNAVKCKKPKMD